MCAMLVREYRSCTCAGSNPVSAEGQTARSVRRACCARSAAPLSAAAGVSRKSRRSIRSASRSAGGVVDVDVLEEVARERVPAITYEPGLIQVVDVAVSMHLVGHVGDEEPFHFTDRRLALGAIGQLALQVVEVVVCGEPEAGVVATADVAAVSQSEEVVRIRPGGRPPQP